MSKLELVPIGNTFVSAMGQYSQPVVAFPSPKYPPLRSMKERVSTLRHLLLHELTKYVEDAEDGKHLVLQPLH